MRLWHYDLIDVLPQKQLVSQWRECLAINGSISKNGTPNHLLVNYVLDYDISVFKDYSNKVYLNMINRGYKPSKHKLDELNQLSNNKHITNDKTMFIEHDLDYLNVCYWNLKEKYLRGGLTTKEWDLINTRYNQITKKED